MGKASECAIHKHPYADHVGLGWVGEALPSVHGGGVGQFGLVKVQILLPNGLPSGMVGGGQQTCANHGKRPVSTNNIMPTVAATRKLVGYGCFLWQQLLDKRTDSNGTTDIYSDRCGGFDVQLSPFCLRNLGR